MKHTEGELKVDGYSVIAPDFKYKTGKPSTICICFPFLQLSSKESLEMMNANAEHLVKCWNNHEDMVEVLEDTANKINCELGEWQSVEALYCPEKMQFMKKLVNNIELLLARLEDGNE